MALRLGTSEHGGTFYTRVRQSPSFTIAGDRKPTDALPDQRSKHS